MSFKQPLKFPLKTRSGHQSSKNIIIKWADQALLCLVKHGRIKKTHNEFSMCS